MKIEYKIYVVTDSHGNKEAVVVNDSSDTIQVCGMEDIFNACIYFEAEGYHLHSWCEDNNLTLNIIDMEAHV